MSRREDGNAPVIAITGANGFVASALCRSFADAGWHVRAGVRRFDSYSPPSLSITPMLVDLPDRIPRQFLEGADVALHAAFSTRADDPRIVRRTNIGGTLAFLHACRKAGVRRRVFISSCSAHPRAEGYYGRSKFALEKEFRGSEDLIIRPGLVLGDGGLFSRMRDQATRARLLPLFDGGHQPLQTVHIDDLARCIRLAVQKRLTGRVVIAEPDLIEMREFLRLLARSGPRQSVFLPIPSAPALALARAAESLGLRLPITADNLRGLRSMIFQPSRADLDRIGCSVRPASQSLRTHFS